MPDAVVSAQGAFDWSQPETADSLRSWVPEDWVVAADWAPVVSPFWRSQAAEGLRAMLQARWAAGAVVYPPQPLRALTETSLADVRVVILGQDPYHGPGQAEGLAFSVARGVKPPPSLRNIFKELARDPQAGATVPPDGSLLRWARQGVLLLNTCLTVEQGRAGSHANQGWEALTDEILVAVVRQCRPLVLMLWGAQAQKKQALLAPWLDAGEAGVHLVLRSNHPSPLSALRPPEPFIGCGHFSRANAFFQRHGLAPVSW